MHECNILDGVNNLKKVENSENDGCINYKRRCFIGNYMVLAFYLRDRISLSKDKVQVIDVGGIELYAYKALDKVMRSQLRDECSSILFDLDYSNMGGVINQLNLDIRRILGEEELDPILLKYNTADRTLVISDVRMFMEYISKSGILDWEK